MKTSRFKTIISIVIYRLRQYPKLLHIRHNVASCGRNLQVFGNPVVVSPNNVYIGDNVILNSNCVLNATHSPLRVGNNVTISYGAMILSGTYDACLFLTKHKRVHMVRETVIGDNVWICAGAIICPGVHIKGRAIIAAGAVVTHDVTEENVVLGGNPAIIVKRY